MHPRRSGIAAGLLAVAWSVLLVGTGGAVPDALRVHQVPGHRVFVSAPAGWAAVDSRSSIEELEAFQRTHRAFPRIVESLRWPDEERLLVAAAGGSTRLGVCVWKAGPGYTLKRHVHETVEGLESDDLGRGVTIEGPHRQIVKRAGGDAWRIRWSFEGDLGRVHVLQYAFVRHGFVYLFSYTTLRRSASVDAAFERSSRTIRLGLPLAPAEPTPAGLIAYEHDDDIYVVDAEGSATRRLTYDGASVYPSWSPDGTRIAFASERGGILGIHVMNADGSDGRRLSSGDAPEGLPSWTSDGTRIVFTRQVSAEAYDLFVMDADGQNVQRLTDDGASMDAACSPDGATILFWSGRDPGSGLYAMDADGTGVRALTPDLRSAWGADWSPSGAAIVFVAVRAGDSVPSIWVMNADGTGKRRIAPTTGTWVDEPEWSPDGRHIAYYADTSGLGEIYVMSADGTQPRLLTTSGRAHRPSWQPSPSRP